MTAIDHRLIDLLVCPLCKSPLQMRRSADGQPQSLTCVADRLAFPIRVGIPVMLRLAFPIRDGIPVMLEGEAQPFDPGADAEPQ
jgi:uncharacterized protein